MSLTCVELPAQVALSRWQLAPLAPAPPVARRCF